MATSGRRAQEAIRAPGSKKCPKHHGKEILFVCEDCDVLVCGECVIQQHKRHGLQGIENSVPEAKQKLQDFITRAEQIEIPRIKGKFQNVNDDLSKNKSKFRKQISLIKKRNETLKKELDKIADTMVKMCRGMEHQNSDTLVNHQKELQTQMDKLESRIQEVRATLQSGNDILVYDTSHVIPSQFEDLPTPSCRVAEFIPGILTLQQLKYSLGIMNITTDDGQQNLSLSQPENWRVVSEFTPYCGYAAMSVYVEGDKSWLSFRKLHGHDSKTMLLVNDQGQVQQTLDMDATVRKFCISPKTGNIWYCSDDGKSVRELKDGKSPLKCRSNCYPDCICVTRDDEILVGYDRHIVKYTQTGQEICRTSEGTQSVATSPKCISQCPVTGHIAVADKDSGHCGGEGEPFISILNDKLQLLHIYRGEVSGQQTPPQPFNPLDVHFTYTGDLVITDEASKCVMLVTSTGEYVKTLYTFPSKLEPTTVTVHNGTLWVTFSDGSVQVLRKK